MQGMPASPGTSVGALRDTRSPWPSCPSCSGRRAAGARTRGGVSLARLRAPKSGERTAAQRGAAPRCGPRCTRGPRRRSRRCRRASNRVRRDDRRAARVLSRGCVAPRTHVWQAALPEAMKTTFTCALAASGDHSRRASARDSDATPQRQERTMRHAAAARRRAHAPPPASRCGAARAGWAALGSAARQRRAPRARASAAALPAAAAPSVAHRARVLGRHAPDGGPVRGAAHQHAAWLGRRWRSSLRHGAGRAAKRHVAARRRAAQGQTRGD